MPGYDASYFINDQVFIDGVVYTIRYATIGPSGL